MTEAGHGVQDHLELFWDSRDSLLFPKEISDLPEPCEAKTMREWRVRMETRRRAWNKRRLKEAVFLFVLSLLMAVILVFGVAYSVLGSAE